MMPLWLAVGLCALAWSSGAFFGFGILEKRFPGAVTIADPDKHDRPHRRRNIMLARYRKPIVYGSLVSSLAVFVWVVTSLFLTFSARFSG